jgi:ubiquitin C-terminal hydrolase
MMSQKPHTLFGLQNLQNTCFFNSAFQCLNSWTLFANYYKSKFKEFEDHS